jgi:hypothetical protein
MLCCAVCCADTPPAEAPATGLAGFANFQGFAQSRPRKPAAATAAAEAKDGAPGAQQQGKPSGALSRLGSSASLDQAGATQQPPKKKQKKAQQQQQQQAAAAAAAAGPPADAGAAAVAAAAAAEGTVDSIPPGTEVFLPLHFPRKKRTTERRPATWVKSCSCFPPPDAPAVSTSTSGKAARPAGSSATAAGAGQDIKSLAASIAASIAADVNADTPPGSAAAGSGSGAAGAAKGGKKKKGAAAAAAAGEGAAAGGAAVEGVIIGSPGAERYACSVCGREFATQGALRIHSNVHAAKNFACTFPGCKKAFAGGTETLCGFEIACAALLADHVHC